MSAATIRKAQGWVIAAAATFAACVHPLQAANSTRDLDKAIETHRKGVLRIMAPPGTPVVVEQLRHEFWFGAALADQVFSGRMNPADREAYLQLFLTNFNSAVTENALKWHGMEPRRGEINYRLVEAMLDWTDRHDLPLRGHNIFWGIPNRVQAWQKDLPDDELRAVVQARALDVGRRFHGRFAEYDLNNEMIHGNYYEDRLGKDITLHMAQWVKQGDPNAVLYLNDYDILTGVRLKDYVRHIRELLDQGVPIGGIGVQGHLHAETFDREALKSALVELSQFKLPIRVTEFNMPGQRSRAMRERDLKLTPEEEAARARELADYYRICFAAPQVEGILMWGFWAGANWIPASALYARDWTPLPAADAYRDLVFREWWTKWQGRTDEAGQCEVKGFYGRYRVKAGDREQVMELRRAEGKQTVSFNKFDGEPLSAILKRGIEARAFPGCTAMIGTDRGIVWSAAFGSQDYSGAKTVSRETVYDLASVTKVAGTTAVIMRLAGLGRIRLDHPVERFVPEFVQAAATPEERQRRAKITLEHLLTHSAGLSSWKPFYKSVSSYSNLLTALYAVPLDYDPGQRSRYSDLSLILAGEVAARAGGMPLPDLERELVFDPLGMQQTLRCPPASMAQDIPPTEIDPTTGQTVRGAVHDENARAGEGITGHAGLFATAEDLGKLARELLLGMDGRSRLFKKEVLEEFFRPRQIGGLTRAVGWNLSTEAGCRVLSHNGFTGTYIQIDLDRKWYAVLLTNRVHPSRDNNKVGSVRREFLDAVQPQMRVGPE